jgi:hypothetical protein
MLFEQQLDHSSEVGLAKVIGNRADGQCSQNGVIGNFTELAENPTLQELAVSNHRRDVPVA